MNKELEQYFKEHNYSIWSSANDPNSYYNASEEIHEDAKYSIHKLIKTDEDGYTYYEEALIDIRKTTFFGDDARFYYIVYATHFGPFFGTGHSTYELTLPHNEELAVEYIEAIRKLMKIPYEKELD